MSTSKQKTFKTKIQQEGKFTFVAIPFSPREVWGAHPRYYVIGTINGHSVRGTLGVLGQDYFLRLSAAWLRENNLAVEADVKVELSLEDRG